VCACVTHFMYMSDLIHVRTMAREDFPVCVSVCLLVCVCVCVCVLERERVNTCWFMR